VSECLKVSYCSRGEALFAMRVIARAYRRRGGTGPRGAYFCGSCRCWHLTSRVGVQTPPWEKGRREATVPTRSR
jgi:hypothetical protein